MSYDFAQLLHALLPEAVLVFGALVVLSVDLGALRRSAAVTRLRVATTLGALGCGLAMLLACRMGAAGAVFADAFMIDAMAVAARVGVAALTLLALGMASGSVVQRHPAEYVAIVLFAATGLSLMASAQNLLVVFLALELASLSLYVLVGFDKTRADSAEAALKYFLFGGMSAAFLLFGFSLLYGLTGSLELGIIAVAIDVQGASPLLAVALVMVVVAFGFKVAAAPFHLWAPDAYQGAPAPAAALIASASKLAGFVLFVRLLWPGAFEQGDVSAGLGGAAWLPVVAVVSAASLLLGNLVALAQSNVRRLLAYSAIAHAGALLIGIIALPAAGVAPLYFYVATYGLATVGAFGVIAVIERTSPCQKLEDLAGLRARSPLLTVCLFVFVLSLAGIPPLAGFFGKFYVFAAALKLGGLTTTAGWLALAAVLFSAVGLYYYLLILKQALVVPHPAGETTTAQPIAVSLGAGAALVIAALLIVAFGVWPAAILRFF